MDILRKFADNGDNPVDHTQTYIRYRLKNRLLPGLQLLTTGSVLEILIRPAP